MTSAVGPRPSYFLNHSPSFVGYSSAINVEKRKITVYLSDKKIFLIKGQSLISFEKQTLEIISNIIKMEEYKLIMKISS